MKMNILKKTVAACSVAAFMAVGFVSVAQAHTDRYGDSYPAHVKKVDANLRNTDLTYVTFMTPGASFKAFCSNDLDHTTLGGASIAKAAYQAYIAIDFPGHQPAAAGKGGPELSCGNVNSGNNYLYINDATTGVWMHTSQALCLAAEPSSLPAVDPTDKDGATLASKAVEGNLALGTFTTTDGTSFTCTSTLYKPTKP